MGKIEDLSEIALTGIVSLANRHGLAHACAPLVLAEVRKRKIPATPVAKSIFLSALDSIEEKDPVLFLTMQSEFDAWAGPAVHIEDELASVSE